MHDIINIYLRTLVKACIKFGIKDHVIVKEVDISDQANVTEMSFPYGNVISRHRMGRFHQGILHLGEFPFFFGTYSLLFC